MDLHHSDILIHIHIGNRFCHRPNQYFHSHSVGATDECETTSSLIIHVHIHAHNLKRMHQSYHIHELDAHRSTHVSYVKEIQKYYVVSLWCAVVTNARKP